MTFQKPAGPAARRQPTDIQVMQEGAAHAPSFKAMLSFQVKGQRFNEWPLSCGGSDLIWFLKHLYPPSQGMKDRGYLEFRG